MRFHKQRFRHDPERGQTGDCFRTMLACLLDLEPEDVPHFMAHDPDKPIIEIWREVDAWLAGRGLRYMAIPFEVADVEALRAWLTSWRRSAPGIRFEVAGMSPRGSNHSVVWMSDRREFWDPHPDGGDLVGPMDDGYYRIGLLLPIAVHGGRRSTEGASA